MTPSEAAELLSLAAAFDRRTVGKADAIAWADALNGYEMADCAEAIRTHFRESSDYLMPVHVRSGVRQIRADRLRAADSSTLEPYDVDPTDIHGYLEASRALRATVAAGQHLEPEPKQRTKRDVEQLLKETLNRLPGVSA